MAILPPPTTPPPTPDPETAEFIVEMIRWQIDGQDARFDSIRTKSTVVLASAGVVFSRLIELSTNADPIRVWCLWIAAIAIAGAGVGALRAVLPHGLRIDPKPRGLIAERHLAIVPLRDTTAVMLRDRYEANQEKIKKLSAALRFSTMCLGVALIAFLLAGVVQWGFPWRPHAAPAAAGNTASNTPAPPPRSVTIPSVSPPTAADSTTTKEGMDGRGTKTH